MRRLPPDAVRPQVDCTPPLKRNAIMTTAPDVLVVLPLYNESATLRGTFAAVAAFAAAQPRFRFLFVDDGSADDTVAVFAGVAPRGARINFYAMPANGGKGAAIRAGFAHATADDRYLLFTDGDLAYDLDHLHRLVERLDAGADVVIGSRSLCVNHEHVTLPRRLLGRAFNRLTRLALGMHHDDTQAGLKGFTAPAAAAIFGRLTLLRFAFDAEAPFLAHRLASASTRCRPASASTTPRWAPPSTSCATRPACSRACSASAGPTGWATMTRRLDPLPSSPAPPPYPSTPSPPAPTTPPASRPHASSRPRVLLSFDLEEFDLPCEYGQSVDEATQIDTSTRGMIAVEDLLDRLSVRATIFCTAHYALARPDLVRRLAQRHEIASHGFTHTAFTNADLARSRDTLSVIIGRDVVGFRRARLADTDDEPIRAAGYRYNSSMNPTWLPGRYNHFDKPRRPWLDRGLLQVPVSVTPVVRMPLFWLAFKNLPLPLMQAATAWTLAADGHVALYFYPWEYVDLSGWKTVPGYVRRVCGAALLAKLERYVPWLARRGEFVTMSEFDAAWRAEHGA